MRTAHSWLIKYLEISGAVGIGKQWQCPAHDDSYPSLSVDEDIETGRVLIYCFGGCEWEEVLDSLRLSGSALFQPHVWSPQKFYDLLDDKPNFADFEWQDGGGSSHKGDYWYKHGSSSYTSEDFHYYTPKVRQRRRRLSTGKKEIIWQMLDGYSWKCSKGGLDMRNLPLYRSEELSVARQAGYLIVLCESESSVDALYDSGIPATTWAGGASAPQKHSLANGLEGAHVLYIADNDKAGLKCLKAIEEFLPERLESWTVMLGKEDEDAKDMLERGALEELKQWN